MDNELILLNKRSLVFHFQTTISLDNPERRVRCTVSHQKYGAVAAMHLLPDDWDRLVALGEGAVYEFVWHKLMSKAMHLASVIDIALELGSSSGRTEAVFHNGPLDGARWKVEVDSKGYPSRQIRTPKPYKLEALARMVDEEQQYEPLFQDITYQREPFPRVDGLWHYFTSEDGQ